HFRDSEAGKDREFRERWSRNVDLEDEVGRRVGLQINRSLAGDHRRVLDIETRVGLEAHGDVFPAKRRRTQIPQVHTRLFGQNLNEQRDGAVEFLVLRGGSHDLQESLAVGEPRRASVGEVLEQPLVGLPTKIFEYNSLL